MNISVIIPYRDRKQNLEVLLHQFNNQRNTFVSIEIVIVDLGSSVLIDNIVSKYNNINHIYVDYKNIFSRGWACNIGAKQSKYDIIWFVDVDCIPHPLALNKIEEHFDPENPNFAVNTPVIFLNSNSANEIISKGSYSWSDYLKYKNSRNYWIKNQIDGTSQIIIHKELFYKIGGYDERFVGHGYEDMLLHDQIAQFIPDFWSKYPDKKEVAWSIKKDLVLTHLYHGARNYRSQYMSRYTKNLRLYKSLVSQNVRKNNIGINWGDINNPPKI